MTKPIESQGSIQFGKIFWPLLAFTLVGGIGWELYTGVAYHKTGGPTARANNPGLFWFEIAFQIVVACGALLVAVRSFRAPEA